MAQSRMEITKGEHHKKGRERDVKKRIGFKHYNPIRVSLTGRAVQYFIAWTQWSLIVACPIDPRCEYGSVGP